MSGPAAVVEARALGGAAPAPPEEEPPPDPEVRRLLGQFFDPNIRFPRHPVFVADLDAFEMPDGLGFQFRGLEAPVILRGHSASAVVRYLQGRLNGRMTREELLRSPPPGVSKAAFIRALLLLHSKGLIVSDAPPRAGPAEALDQPTLSRQLLYWGRHLGITRAASSASEVADRLERARLVVLGGGMFGAVTSDLLARSGFRRLAILAWSDDGTLERTARLSPEGPAEFCRLPTTALDPALEQLAGWLESADLFVTATSDAPALLFRGINDLALRMRTPWLFGNADGPALDIGPLVQPYESGCFACLELRRQSAREFAFEHEFHEQRLARERDASVRRPVGEAVWPLTLGASILVGEACRVITGLAPPTLTDSVLHLLPVTGTIERNRFTRVPRCPACFRGAIAEVEAVC